jgi:hypothetical protein
VPAARLGAWVQDLQHCRGADFGISGKTAAVRGPTRIRYGSSCHATAPSRREIHPMPSENTPPTPHAAGSTERRSGKDRRHAESSAPPGGRERRRNVEPRRPDVAELDLSLSQWDALNELPLPVIPPKK